MQHEPLPTMPATTRLPTWLVAVLVLLSVIAIAGPLAIVRTAPPILPAAKTIVRAQRVVPKTIVPQAEPVILQAVAPEDARAFNATIPFSTAPNPAASPFRIYGSVEDQTRALDCLAAAVIYEAGDDTDGGRAVAQVVLNRMRHPAFPKSVCGVVFQGAERRTGCQFTFTCDGALMRAVSPAAWGRAREVARAALNGFVDRRVGHATHYHTDWVVPYWSSSLDKITEVKTHLFFRWTGWWGTPAAFGRRYAGAEPMMPKLARLSNVHGSPVDGAEAGALPVAVDPALLATDAVIPKGLEQDSGTFISTLPTGLIPSQLPAYAARVCGDRPYCKFMAWSSKAETPGGLPVTPGQQRTMAFSYLRDQAYGFDKALWNCTIYKGLAPNQCMKAQLSITMAPVPPADMKYDSSPGSVLRAIAGAGRERPKVTEPDPLTGIRRKVAEPASMSGTAVPAPKATPTPVPVPKE
jgi:spore germination cell wall hydrolase CwlJ-like protein